VIQIKLIESQIKLIESQIKVTALAIRVVFNLSAWRIKTETLASEKKNACHWVIIPFKVLLSIFRKPRQNSSTIGIRRCPRAGETPLESGQQLAGKDRAGIIQVNKI